MTTIQTTEQIENIETSQTNIETSNIETFIDKCIEYNKNHPEIDIKQLIHPTDPTNDINICPVHLYASNTNNQKSCHDIIPGTKNCKLCGEPECPICHNHKVTQLSRVTGYVGDISGWNAAKKQELLDRRRYSINGDENL